MALSILPTVCLSLCLVSFTFVSSILSLFSDLIFHILNVNKLHIGFDPSALHEYATDFCFLANCTNGHVYGIRLYLSVVCLSMTYALWLNGMCCRKTV